MALPKPNFIERDPARVVAEMVEYYQGLVDKPLEPAQAERLLINAFAYRESLLRNDIQSAAEQNLVAFARFPQLDYLGELVGVTRLPAAPAIAQIKFYIISAHPGIVIPSGLRVQTTDGRFVFQTMEDVTVAAGVTEALVAAAAQVSGIGGNGYGLGTVTVILDPQPYLASATNVAITDGGADEETDDQLRERIKLAPSSFSNAGSEGAYRFFASSAHPSIVDVGIGSSTPGTVEVYPLSKLGIPTPVGVIEATEAILTSERVRPLSDTVIVASPTAVTYDLEVEITALTNSDTVLVGDTAQAAAQAYVDAKGSKLGQDIVVSQIIGALQSDGVYKVTVVSPSSDLSINFSEVAKCNSVTVTVTATHDA